ncbi:hypothetical protein [Nitrosopumilus cobalaminigenes]|nr:hypothetical protein [Nitrosopumilus cobalaminigenes]
MIKRASAVKRMEKKIEESEKRSNEKEWVKYKEEVKKKKSEED